MTVLLYLLAILPSILIGYFVFRTDKNDREATRNLLLCFILGMLVTIPAMKLEALETQLPTVNGQLTFGALLFSTFVLVAVVEEFFKTLPLLLFFYPKKYFNEPLDGIVYSVMIAMGFALVENLFYAYQFGWQTTLVRAFTAVPAHGALAVIIGYYVGLAKFNPEQKYRLITTGFLQAILIHGCYDFFIIQEYNEDLMVFTALILTLSLYYAIRLIRQHQKWVKPTPEELVETVEENEIADAVLRSMNAEEEE